MSEILKFITVYLIILVVVPAVLCCIVVIILFPAVLAVNLNDQTHLWWYWLHAAFIITLQVYNSR